jgi:phage gp46-like protein
MSDLYVQPTPDGGEITIVNGEPRKTSGLETAVYFSLFTAEWWGNAIADSPERYRSRIPAILDGRLTPATARRIEQAAVDALQWLIDTGTVERVEPEAEIVGSSQLHLRVTIYEQQGDTVVGYAINWDAQEATLL